MENNSARISVKDNGVGIREEDKKKIFHRFERGLNANHYGMGLGLFISKQIVDLHKGEIGVESTLGSGSEFTVTLPL